MGRAAPWPEGAGEAPGSVVWAATAPGGVVERAALGWTCLSANLVTSPPGASTPACEQGRCGPCGVAMKPVSGLRASPQHSTEHRAPAPPQLPLPPLPTGACGPLLGGSPSDLSLEGGGPCTRDASLQPPTPDPAPHCGQGARCPGRAAPHAHASLTSPPAGRGGAPAAQAPLSVPPGFSSQWPQGVTPVPLFPQEGTTLACVTWRPRTRLHARPPPHQPERARAGWPSPPCPQSRTQGTGGHSRGAAFTSAGEAARSTGTPPPQSPSRSTAAGQQARSLLPARPPSRGSGLARAQWHRGHRAAGAEGETGTERPVA